MAKIITNHQERPLFYFHELTEKDQKIALKEYYTYMNEEESRFFKYKGDLYILDDFMVAPLPWNDWDAYLGVTIFSGILIKIKDGVDGQNVVVCRYFSD
jgi:hypothetical protein